ncbi:MAG: ATPase [Chloroflexia bacterium]
MSDELARLLDELEKTLAQSGRLPFLRRLLVEEDRAMGLLDRLRAAVPEEVRRARQVLREREQILEQARRQAQRIAEQAQQEAAMRIEEQGLLEEAKKRSEQILEEARREAERIRRGADQYAREVLTEIEARLSQAQGEIRETMGRILASIRKGLAELEGESPGEEE